MNILPPKIDKRTIEQLLEEFRLRASSYLPEWNYKNSDEAGYALSRIFMEMLQQVQFRLNQFLQKSRIAFLDTLGIDLQPAQPAKSWVVFNVVEGAPANVVVDSGSEMTGKGVDSDLKEREMPFQTCKDLVVSPAKLTDIVSINANDDAVYLHSPGEKGDNEVQPFNGFNVQEHSLYIAHSNILNLNKQATICVYFSMDNSSLKNLSNIIEKEKNTHGEIETEYRDWFQWEYWNGKKWVSFGNSNYDSTNSLSRSGELKIIKNCTDELAMLLVNGIENRWIRCRALEKLSNTFTEILPEISNIKIGITGEMLQPEMLFSNSDPLDPYRMELSLESSIVKKMSVKSVKLMNVNDNNKMLCIEIICDKDLKLCKNDKIGFDDGRQMVILEIIEGNINGDTLKRNVNCLVDYIKEESDIKNGISVYLLTDEFKILIKIPDKKEIPINSYMYLDPIVNESENIRIFEIKEISKDKNIATVTLKRSAKFNGTIANNESWEKGKKVNVVPHILPFGDKPFTGTIFYFAIDEAMSKREATITLTLEYYLNGLPAENETEYSISAKIIWEYWNGTSKSWRRLNVYDNSNGFTMATYTKGNSYNRSNWNSAKVEFRCPSDADKVKVNSEEKYWIRARLLSGDFGKGFETIDKEIYLDNQGHITTDKENTTVIKTVDYIKKPVHFPVIGLIDVTYTTEPENPHHCITYNNADFKDVTVINYKNVNSFLPFERLPVNKNTLYFGFNKKLTGAPMRMLFSIEKEIWEEQQQNCKWENWNGSNFEELKVTDTTNGFRNFGYVEFAGKYNFYETELFGKKKFWLRVIQPDKDFAAGLTFNGMYINAVDVIQSSFVKDEQLGASNGTANQSFTCLYSPIISQEVWIREQNIPDDKELMIIEKEEGNNSWKIIEEGKPFTGEIWIRWHEMEDFYDSKRNDRHYKVDKRTGTIIFGNGESGMIPPKAAANILITYRHGGGMAGNVSPNAISNMKTSIPFIESVRNPFFAAGGAEAEKIEETIVNGTALLEHKNRAVTTIEYENLACQVSRSVVRSKCIPHMNPDGNKDTGWITLIIIPNTIDRPPEPNHELISVVKSQIKKVCMQTITNEQKLHVRGAKYKKVKIKAKIQPKDVSKAAAVEQQILQSLDTFLDPIHGGNDNTGWKFGTALCKSMIIGVLKSVNEVDYVAICEIFVDEKKIDNEIELDEDTLLLSGKHEIELKLNDDSMIKENNKVPQFMI